jgi:hypothetical protein
LAAPAGAKALIFKALLCGTAESHALLNRFVAALLHARSSATANALSRPHFGESHALSMIDYKPAPPFKGRQQ